MKYSYLVLGGAGRQGAAIAYDLLCHGQAKKVEIADKVGKQAQDCAQKLNFLSQNPVADGFGIDVIKQDLDFIIESADVVISALPFVFNEDIAKIAARVGTHYCDLGGNTKITQKILQLHDTAKEKNVSLLPDCGLAPGLSNVLASKAIAEFDSDISVHIRCGGLPQIPRPPLNYKLVFNFDGLINEYSGNTDIIRNGKIESISALEELESVEIEGKGQFEAFITTGGTSTATESFLSKVQNFDYKTLRYPGHRDCMKAYEALGLFKQEPIKVGDSEIPARQLFQQLINPSIDHPSDRDFIVLTAKASGKKAGEDNFSHYQAILLEEATSTDGFTSMEKTTGFPTGAIAYMQAQGKIPEGSIPIEQSVPIQEFFQELEKRGIIFKETHQ